MATVDVSVSSHLDPKRAWMLASDLRRFDEWLTIFGGWRSEVPAEIEAGTCVSSLIKVKGFRNIIHWRVTRYDEPKVIELLGRGRGGICIALKMRVDQHDSGSGSSVASGSGSSVASGSTFHVVAELSGGVLNTRVGRLVAKILESDVRKSVTNLAAMR
jgi:hypothetical protein